MIQNSCVISSIAKAFNISVRSVHFTALAMGIDCKINGLTNLQAIRVIHRLKEKKKKPIKGCNLLIVLDSVPDYHCILSVDNKYWCPNIGYLNKLPNTFLPYCKINILKEKETFILNTKKDIIKFCNSNCNYNYILNKKELDNWIERKETLSELIIEHILYWRHVRS